MGIKTPNFFDSFVLGPKGHIVAILRVCQKRCPTVNWILSILGGLIGADRGLISCWSFEGNLVIRKISSPGLYFVIFVIFLKKR
jgi:hypothetical protein